MVVTDVPCAYLIALMPIHDLDKLVFVRIDAFSTSMMITVDPSMRLLWEKLANKEEKLSHPTGHFAVLGSRSKYLELVGDVHKVR